MSHAARTRSRQADTPRRWQRSVWYIVGALALVALYLVGHGLLPQRAQDHVTPAMPSGQPVAYHRVPTLLRRARTHDPLLRLPHARWFIRIRHGHERVIVVDSASLHGRDSTVVGTGGDKP